MSYCVRCTCCLHTCGWFSLQKTCSREFYREKNLYRGHQSKMVKCLCWRAELCLYPASLSLPQLSVSFVFLLLCFSSLFNSPDCGVSSPLSSREMRLTCRGLKGICSAHQVCIMSLLLWTAPPENVKQAERRAYIDPTQCAHSRCYTCYSQGTPLGSGSVMAVSGYWIEQDV